MKRKPPAATVSTAVNRLLDKRQREAVINLTGDALIHRTTIQAIRYLLNLGIVEHDRRLERERELLLKWDSDFFSDYARKHAPNVGDTIIWPEVPPDV